jgi:hypothetical protein
MTKLIFCAGCQNHKEHKIEILSHEVIAHCDCGFFIKFPPLKNAGALRAMFDTQYTANVGQVKAVEYVPDTDVASAIENA